MKQSHLQPHTWGKDLTVGETQALHLAGAATLRAEPGYADAKPGSTYHARLEASAAIVSALDAVRTGREESVQEHLRAFVIAYDAGFLERNRDKVTRELESTYHALALAYQADYTAIWAELPAPRVIEDLPARGTKTPRPPGRHR